MPDKRSLILQGTLDLIDERGLQSTPMSAIAKRSGVAMGTIYHHFESKEELVAALYVELIDRLGEYALQDTMIQLQCPLDSAEFGGMPCNLPCRIARKSYFSSNSPTRLILILR